MQKASSIHTLRGTYQHSPLRVAVAPFRAFALVAFFFLLGMFHVQAQISSPGVSGSKAVTWGALGVTQHLGNNNRWVSTTYVGLARKSDPHSWDLVKKQGLLVLNEEVVYGFNPHWQLSAALSFREQNEYASEAPYALEDPAHKYEVRYYSRLYYKHKLKQVSMTYTFRPELRTFYQSSDEPLDTPQEIRIRLKAQASIPLNSTHRNFLIGGNEFLTVTDETPDKHWSAYHFSEDRLSMYFRHVFADAPVIVDLGLMEQFKQDGHTTSYLAFDVILQDPFGHKASAH